MICIGALLFTSSMIMNVTYGILTGIGTIDRLKKKANDTVYLSDEEPMDLKDVFGVSGYWTWCLPIDPVFEDYDRVMGYSTPQRLLREHRSMADAAKQKNRNKMMMPMTGNGQKQQQQQQRRRNIDYDDDDDEEAASGTAQDPFRSKRSSPGRRGGYEQI
eukprot:CAMPEP_0202441506 /NCGR_PEP_ID=MMETSP1360-20130828/1050_1 /ASSEMBLY_ACC=CAM_ASM_000848 /TAXON_ID=515479 /ORGANISM="Licmophora paradoxa, Strain CCMP2313" /LENGTH=159 /DNA_ID=CAMNT_0049056531 /DNA_START=773 /DNA_END=1252 /DNA_ORIENTATION=-